jgi:ribosomal protein S18 acetylase RimI-like enzyme
VIVSWIPDADALYRFAGPQPRWPFSVAQLREREGRPGHSAWVLDDAGAPAGQFELTVTDGDAWLSRVIIDPSRRGQGLARTLVRFALDEARAHGATGIGLKVIAGNDAAIRTYLAAGFQATGGAERDDVIAMRAELRRDDGAG